MKFVVFLCILPIVILIKLRAGITFGSYILFTEATHVQKTSFFVSQMASFHGLNFIFCFPYYTDNPVHKSFHTESKRRKNLHGKKNLRGWSSFLGEHLKQLKPCSNRSFHLLSPWACTLLAGDGHLARHQSPRYKVAETQAWGCQGQQSALPASPEDRAIKYWLTYLMLKDTFHLKFQRACHQPKEIPQGGKKKKRHQVPHFSKQTGFRIPELNFVFHLL